MVLKKENKLVLYEPKNPRILEEEVEIQHTGEGQPEWNESDTEANSQVPAGRL